MQAFVYSYPTKVYFGQGAAKQALEAELSGYGPNVLLAHGGGSVKKNGVYDAIVELLKAAGKTVTDFSGIMSNPTYAKVQEGARLARDNQADMILPWAAAAQWTAVRPSLWQPGMTATSGRISGPDLVSSTLNPCPWA